MILQATSRKGKSRIGAAPVLASVEQRLKDRLFVVFPNGYCCWMPPDGGEHFAVLPDGTL